MPKPPARALRGSAQQTRLVLESFLTASANPVLIEPGEPPFALRPDCFAIEVRDPYVLLSVWDDTRNWSRKVSSAVASRTGRLELEVERFGKRAGTTTLVDLARPQNEHWNRRSDRMLGRERLRQSLGRQYPDFRVVELSSEPDLEHSLSPVCSRAFLRRGTTGIAAIGASDASSAHVALTCGLIWLDYLRRREPKCSVETLAVFLPPDCTNDTALRLRYLEPGLARYELWIISEDGYEDRVDWLDTGNIDTRVEPRAAVNDVDAHHLAGRLKQLAGVETVEAPGGASFRVQGLELARLANGKLAFGIDSKQPAGESDWSEIARMTQMVQAIRTAGGSSQSNPLFQREPERWLESMVRGNIEALDASLVPAPVYGQVPALAGGSRDVLDLLAACRDGRLAILELKATEDIHLPIQALDYWIRVNWHLRRGDFAANGYFPGIELRAVSPKLLLVGPALCLHPANETVLRYFSSEVEVEQVGISVEWRRELRVVYRGGRLARRNDGIWPGQERKARNRESQSGRGPA